jgi:hypothetical protein
MKDTYTGIPLTVHQRLAGADADHRRIAKEAQSQRPQPDTEDVESRAKSFKHPGITIGKWWTEMDGIARELTAALTEFAALGDEERVDHPELGQLMDMCVAVLLTSGVPVRLGGWTLLEARPVVDAYNKWNRASRHSSQRPPLIIEQPKHKTVGSHGPLRVLVLHVDVFKLYVRVIRAAVLAKHKDKPVDGLLFPWGGTGSTFKLHDTLRRGIKGFIQQGWIRDDGVRAALEHDQGSDVCQTSFRKLVTDTDLTEAQLTGLARMQGHHPETLKRYYQEAQRQKDAERDCLDLVAHLRVKAADSQVSRDVSSSTETDLDGDVSAESESDESNGIAPTQLFREDDDDDCDDDRCDDDRRDDDRRDRRDDSDEDDDEIAAARATVREILGEPEPVRDVLVDSPFIDSRRRRFSWKHFEREHNKNNVDLDSVLQLAPRSRRVAVARRLLEQLGAPPAVVDWLNESRVKDYLNNKAKQSKKNA